LLRVTPRFSTVKIRTGPSPEFPMTCLLKSGSFVYMTEFAVNGWGGWALLHQKKNGYGEEWINLFRTDQNYLENSRIVKNDE